MPASSRRKTDAKRITSKGLPQAGAPVAGDGAACVCRVPWVADGGEAGFGGAGPVSAATGAEWPQAWVWGQAWAWVREWAWARAWAWEDCPARRPTAGLPGGGMGGAYGGNFGGGMNRGGLPSGVNPEDTKEIEQTDFIVQFHWTPIPKEERVEPAAEGAGGAEGGDAAAADDLGDRSRHIIRNAAQPVNNGQRTTDFTVNGHPTEDILMDKLQPLIRHKFWIIFGLTLPIALFAYFSASGKMAEATTAQETKLDTTLKGVTDGASDPNETYAAGAKVINEEMNVRFETQVQKLWELQTERMTWPKVMVERVPKKFRGEINKSDRYHYMRAYPAILERVWERVQPYVGDKRTNPYLRNKDVDWPQKVLINGMALPHAEFDMSAPADNDEIWDAQEDIWLLELIFDAVVRTNADASFVSDAPVREIDYINLTSGSGESSVVAMSTGGYGGEDMMDAGGAMGAEMMGMMGGGKGGRGGAGGLGNIGGVSFNVAEEFGPPVPIPPEEGEGGMGMGAGDEYEMGMGMGMGAGAMAAGMGAMMGGGALQAGMKVQRYMGPDGMDPFEGPYRERGFYMSVIILQEKIPDFLAELSSSPWPIRIGRFQFGPNPYAPQDMSGGQSGFGMAGMGGGRHGDAEGFGGAAWAWVAWVWEWRVWEWAAWAWRHGNGGHGSWAAWGWETWATAVWAWVLWVWAAWDGRHGDGRHGHGRFPRNGNQAAPLHDDADEHFARTSCEYRSCSDGLLRHYHAV